MVSPQLLARLRRDGSVFSLKRLPWGSACPMSMASSSINRCTPVRRDRNPGVASHTVARPRIAIQLLFGLS